MAYNVIPTRPHVRGTEQVMGLIAPGTCWHFDAWMMRASDGLLYVKVQTRAGGREVLTEHEYVIEDGRIRYAATIPASAEFITLQDRAEWPRFEELNAAHWRHVVPMAARIPAGFRSRSVALHYVRAPSLAPFPDDVVNMTQA